MDEVSGAEPPSISELSEHFSRHIKPGTPPLLDVGAFYASRPGRPTQARAARPVPV